VSGQRLDEALVVRGLFTSRSRARDAVARGTVWVNGEPARKPAQTVSNADALTVEDPAQGYVSRSALKLVHGLDQFGIAVAGRNAVDVGASTGGFTQVLLERGAAHVVALDVGHGQMAPQLAADHRVRVFEGVNARAATREHVPAETGLIVCDVSFISLQVALPAVLALVGPGTQLVALVKPQFEVGRENVGKGGIVREANHRARAVADVQEFLEKAGWLVKGIVPSPLAGGDGNEEYLLHAVKR
jgi:23S rRNA (cytidine1920-2'-O)/16S rRNA (cytidine1409-2'-O)-methyltransferase